MTPPHSGAPRRAAPTSLGDLELVPEEVLREVAGVGLCVLDAREGVVWTNRAYTKLFGAQDGSPPGASRYLSQDGSPLPPGELPGPRVLRGEPIKHAIVGVRGSEGRTTWTLVHAVLLEGRRARALVTATDISELWGYTSALDEREASLRVIFETAADAVITIGGSGRIEQVNPATERIFGYSAAELVGQDVSILVPHPEAAHHDRFLERYAAAGPRTKLGIGREVVARRRDGTEFPAELTVSEFFVRGARRFTGIIRDVSERKKIDLQVSEHELRLRAQLAYDLHDSLGQLLAGGRFLAQNLVSDLPGDLGQRMSRIVELLSEALEKVRGLSNSLSALEMAGTSFTRALQVLAKKVASLYALDCRLDVRPGTVDPPASQGNQAFLVIEEALANAARHSGCTAISIRFELTAGRYHLSVRDDGRGIGNEPPASGLGLTTMHHRARLLGGSLGIRPVTPVGTEVHLDWPAKPPGVAP